MYFSFLSAPSSSPQSVLATVIGSMSISISWAPPPQDEKNGIIREYLVSVKSADNGEVMSFSTQSTSMTILGLRPHTSYNFRIAAVTVAAGPFSSDFVVTTAQDGMLIFSLQSF